MSLMKWFAFCLMLFAAGVAAACGAPSMPEPLPIPPTDSPERALTIRADSILRMGQQQYELRCAHCHGYMGEGQLRQTIEYTLSIGMKTVPAHDATGHTWQHPDQLLYRVIAEGVENPLNQYPMEAYAGTMSDAEIRAVIAYMKLWWTDEQRAFQQHLTETFPGGEPMQE